MADQLEIEIDESAPRITDMSKVSALIPVKIVSELERKLGPQLYHESLDEETIEEFHRWAVSSKSSGGGELIEARGRGCFGEAYEFQSQARRERSAEIPQARPSLFWI